MPSRPRSVSVVAVLGVIQTFGASALLGLVGCERPPEPASLPIATSEPVANDSSNPEPGVPTSTPSRKPSGKRSGKPSGPPASAPDATPPEARATEESRIRSGENTRGVIQCGESSCAPGKQVCAGTSVWQCVDSDAVPQAAEIRYHCDDGTDCPQGETCCLGFESGVEAYVCSKRRGPETNCRLEICADGGARCSKGQVCHEGVCKSADRRATCNDKGRCPSERPLCVWSERETSCTTWDEFVDDGTQRTAALRCTRRTDCGPEARCCTNAIWSATQCLTGCDSGNEGEVCTSDADCAPRAGRPHQGKCVSVKDREIASLPAWLKVCAYDR